MSTGIHHEQFSENKSRVLNETPIFFDIRLATKRTDQTCVPAAHLSAGKCRCLLGLRFRSIAAGAMLQIFVAASD
jgi:hypothetical protein